MWKSRKTTFPSSIPPLSPSLSSSTNPFNPDLSDLGLDRLSPPTPILRTKLNASFPDTNTDADASASPPRAQSRGLIMCATASGSRTACGYGSCSPRTCSNAPSTAMTCPEM